MHEGNCTFDSRIRGNTGLAAQGEPGIEICLENVKEHVRACLRRDTMINSSAGEHEEEVPLKREEVAGNILFRDLPCC